MNKTKLHTLVSAVLLAAAWLCPVYAEEEPGSDAGTSRFQEICNRPWKLVLHDPCTGDWRDHWTLDGVKAKISNSPEGMVFAAGPVHRDDSCHAVLWTKRSFPGDIRMDYEYTKLDETVHNVTILYVQATGSGIGGFDKDISRWSRLRQIPSMSHYFNHMNTYHISYAAFGVSNTDPEEDYIRARRYLPETGKGLRGTELRPDYARTGFFQTGVPHKITVIKQKNDLYMHIRNRDSEKLCHWNNDSLPPVTDGRIGLRHMYTRIARYKDVRVSLGDRQESPKND